MLKPFSLSRINDLELAVLTCLDFSVAIPASEYAKYYYLLRNMMIRGGLLLNHKNDNNNETTTNPTSLLTLNTDKANLLENRTMQYQDSMSKPNSRRQARSVDWSVLSGGIDTIYNNKNNNNDSSSGGASAGGGNNSTGSVLTVN